MSANELDIAFAYAGEIMAAGIVLPLVGMCVVALRFWMRKSAIGMDDWTILGALVFITAMGASLIYGVSQQTLGYASAPFPSLEAELFEITETQRLTELLLWLTWILMVPGNGLIKSLESHLFSAFFGLLLFFFATIFGCGLAVDDSWAPLATIGSCNTNMRLEALVTTDLATDIFVWALPMVPVWGLHMKRSQKLYVTGIFALSAVSLVAAVVRLIIETEIMNGGYAATTNADLTLGDLIYWSMIESGLALIAACLPTLHHIVTRAPIRSAISSVRSTFKANSYKSEATLNNASAYSEISATTKISQTSSRITDLKPFDTMTDEEDTIVLSPVVPLRAHIHSPFSKSRV